MNSFDILSNTAPLQPRLFLEASAGTGKTFTIEHLVVRLLLETPMRLDEVLIVTFTRAATRELKERIYSNLEKIFEQTIDHPYLQDLTQLQQGKIEFALKNFDTAQIFTIHGFCSHLLKHFAIEAGVGLNLTEWSREEEEWEVKEFLRTQSCLSSGQTQRLLGLVHYDLDRLVETVLRSSENSSSTLSSEEWLHEVQTHLTKIAPFPVTAEFERIRPSYKGMTSENFLHQAEQLEEALKDKKLSSKIWEEWVSSSSFFLENFCPDQLKARAQPPTSEPLAQLREIILPRLQMAQNPDQILLRLRSAWHAHQQNISQQKEKITPDDLLKIVHAKLTETSFVEAVRKKYQAVIVDEFQDTDPIQWDIFKTLFLEDPQKSAYLVGDPKQSIYAFRSADIYTFLEAAKEFGIEQKAALLRNFRSSSQLLLELNRLFSANPWMDLPKQGIYLDIPEAISVHEGEGKLCFMVAEGEKGRSSKWPTSEMEEKLFLPFIAQEIQHLKPADVAILVKDRYQAERVHRFLSQWQIPSILYRSSPLGESPVIEFLSEVADACLDHHSLSAIKKVLLGPFASIPMHELNADLVFKAKHHFEELRDLWLEEGFATFFAQFLQTRFGKETALATFYHFQHHTLYEDLIDLTQKMLLAHHPYHLQQMLSDLKTYEKDDRICAHPDGVQIMTTHASKGLEFENVFALGLASRSPLQDLPEDKLKELDAEKMRQFYVALTRAKKRLYIPIARQLPAPSYKLGEGSPVELFLAKAQPDLTSFSQEFLNARTFNLKPYEMKSSTPLTPPPPLRPAFPPRLMQSFSSIAQDVIVPAKGEDQGIEAGAQTGVIVHRILERYFNQEGDLRQLIKQEIDRTKLSSKADELHHMLLNILALPLDNFTLNDISFDRLQTEMEFLYTTEQGWMKGYIDLCFEHDGRFYAIDWKTNLLPNTDPSTLLELMQSHDYLLQGHIYQEAIQRYLKRFPSLTFGGIYFVFIRGPAAYHFV